MAVGTVPHPVQFTRDDLNAAANAALQKVTEARWIRAIERALVNLSTGQFSYDGQHVILKSATGDSRYVINTTEPMQCRCTAHRRGLVCWHVTAARLIVRAAEHHQAR